MNYLDIGLLKKNYGIETVGDLAEFAASKINESFPSDRFISYSEMHHLVYNTLFEFGISYKVFDIELTEIEIRTYI